MTPALRRLFARIALALWGLVASWAHALTIQPYTADALAQLQEAGKPVVVHFHADWCSTCKRQERSLQTMQNDPALAAVTVLVANYDQEKELRRALKVRSQSMMVVFKGKQEVWRVTGQTQPHDLKAAFAKAL